MWRAGVGREFCSLCKVLWGRDGTGCAGGKRGGSFLGHAIWNSGLGVFVVTFWRVFLRYFFPPLFSFLVYRRNLLVDATSWITFRGLVTETIEVVSFVNAVLANTKVVCLWTISLTSISTYGHLIGSHCARMS